MKASGIYQITSINNGRVYIGSAICIRDRWRDHKKLLRAGKHPNKLLQRSWIKHGDKTFIFEVVEVVRDKSGLVMREQLWLDLIFATIPDFVFNICAVAHSKLGVKHSAETRAKLSGRVHTAQTLAKMSAAQKGVKKAPRTPEHCENIRTMWTRRIITDEQREALGAGRRGKTHTPEARAKMSAALVGKKPTPEAVAKRVQSMLGHAVSPETRAKLSVANAGQVCWNKGGTLSAETRAKISLANGGENCLPETRAKISAAATLRLADPVVYAEQTARCLQLAQARVGKPLSPAHRAKIGARGLGRPVSAETRAKLRASHLARRLPP